MVLRLEQMTGPTTLPTESPHQLVGERVVDGSGIKAAQVRGAEMHGAGHKRNSTERRRHEVPHIIVGERDDRRRDDIP